MSLQHLVDKKGGEIPTVRVCTRCKGEWRGEEEGIAVCCMDREVSKLIEKRADVPKLFGVESSADRPLTETDLAIIIARAKAILK